MSCRVRTLILGSVVGTVLLAVLIMILNLVPSKPLLGKGPVGGIHDINDGEMTYSATYPKIGFSPRLAALGRTTSGHPDEEHAGLLSDNIASGVAEGYRFIYVPVWDAKTHTNIGYTVHAEPIPQPAEPPTWLQRMFSPHTEKEQRHFFSDQSGLIRYENGKEASAASPAL